MKRFLFSCCCFGSLLAILLAASLIWRIAAQQPALRDSLTLRPDQSVLFVGDSHIGCTFVEAPRFHNRVLWASSLPQQFTLMRLLDMERLGTLAPVRTLVLDIGLQSFGQQDHSRLNELTFRSLGFAWRHLDRLPLDRGQFFLYLILHPTAPMYLVEASPTQTISILDQPLERRQKEFQDTANLHFNWISRPEAMAPNWQTSLKKTILEIQALCTRHNIRLVFFTAPLTSYYRQAIPPELENLLQHFADFIRAQGIPYYDLRDWCDDRDFFDSFHLTRPAAGRFTERFYRDILHAPLDNTL